MSRPRVTASHIREPITQGTWGGPNTRTTVGIALSVDFDLHDHEAALAALDAAVADVRSQIAETT